MPAENINQWFLEDPSRILGKVEQVQRNKGRVSALMKKSTLPTGHGYNFSSIITNRSTKSGGGWVDVNTPENVNNCVVPPSTVSPARSQYTYRARETVLFSQRICLDDATAGYNFREQVATDRDNFVGNVVDTWEDEDKAQFIKASDHKIVLNSSFSESHFGDAIPNSEATSQISQDFLDKMYIQIIQDGGGEEPYARKNGAALLPLIISFEGSRQIQKGDSTVREDIRFAEQGQGDAARLLNTWSVDRAMGGFMHIIDTKMPRYNFVGGAYVEVPYYVNDDTNCVIGSEAIVNPAYHNASFEAAFIWHPDVVHRQVPGAVANIGSDATGRAWNFNGDIQWLNIPSEDENPFSNIGRWAARLKAAYRPVKPRYGYVLIYKRCPGIASVACPSY